ncbi:MAG: hypothetical protein KA313_02890 [Pseudarcicella sp.]|nr:hypothetical protein [Pseudarcicella sp.]MBP6410024.1 hypothetical protein [Pseudarcicella sp.]
MHVDSKVYSATIDEISNADSLSTVHHDTINFIADGTYNRFFKYFEGTYTVTNDLKGIKFVNKMPQNGAIVSLEIKYSFEKNETLLKLLTSELTEKKENEGVDVEILREKMEDIVKLKGGDEALKSYKVLKMYIIHKKIK